MKKLPAIIGMSILLAALCSVGAPPRATGGATTAALIADPTITNTPSLPEKETPTPTATSIPPGTEAIVLQEAAEALDCPSGICVEDTTYSFTCVVAAGHSADARIQRFESPADARAAFDAERGDRPVQCYYDYPAYTWQYDESPGTPGFPLRHRGHAWQAGRWLVVTHSFDDTAYEIAPAPLTVSDAIYQAAAAHSLFPSQVCTMTYMPTILKHST